MEIINSPSLANCKLLSLGDQVRQLVDGGCEWFHVDIMDGHYVPNICFPVKLVRELKDSFPQVEADVHLMVENPMDYFAPLREAGADWVSFHLDSTNFSRRCIDTIHSMGMKAGIAINPSQSVDIIKPLIDYIDYVVLMTVEPGYAGQKFMVDSLPRLKDLVELRKAYSKKFLISIDGGVDMENAVKCVKLGAEVYVTGIYTVFNQEDSLSDACRRFKRTLLEALS